VTVGVAQAADLPMTKAEPVEYVKVCTEFGEGFFYLPGTDTCLKISGEVRADYRFGTTDTDTRLDDKVFFAGEGRIKFDARTATEYGTLRSYFQINAKHQAGVTGFSIDKAFIQFGGLTAGYAHTFFGIYDADYANTIFAPYFTSQSTVNLLAYTAVFGGGFSATLSVEDGLDHQAGLWDDTIGIPASYGGQTMPDVVGNLRFDGGWGEAAVFGAVHQVRYPLAANDTDYGFAVGAGAGINLPWMAGGHIAVEATYADGASNYLGLGGGTGGAPDASFSTTSVLAGSAGFDTDAGSGWSITGEIGMGWSPAFVVTAFGSYVDYSNGTPDRQGLTPFIDNPDFQAWVAGINAWYTIVPGLSVGAEVYYEDFSYDNTVDTVFVEDNDTWAGGVRIKRVF
jgi:hypothetical protein